MSVVELLKAAGWNEVGSRRHKKWRCPCGEHQISSPSTGSDWRGEKNLLAEIRRMNCPSIKELEIDPDHPWPVDAELKCQFCGAKLIEGRYKKDWVYHNGTFACLWHPGIDKWHKEQCREKKKNGDGKDD